MGKRCTVRKMSGTHLNKTIRKVRKHSFRQQRRIHRNRSTKRGGSIWDNFGSIVTLFTGNEEQKIIGMLNKRQQAIKKARDINTELQDHIPKIQANLNAAKSSSSENKTSWLSIMTAVEKKYPLFELEFDSNGKLKELCPVIHAINDPYAADEVAQLELQLSKKISPPESNLESSNNYDMPSSNKIINQPTNAPGESYTQDESYPPDEGDPRDESNPTADGNIQSDFMSNREDKSNDVEPEGRPAEEVKRSEEGNAQLARGGGRRRKLMKRIKKNAFRNLFRRKSKKNRVRGFGRAHGKSRRR